MFGTDIAAAFVVVAVFVVVDLKLFLIPLGIFG